jgi:hypothetical protein
MDEKAVDKRAKLYRAISGLVPGGSILVEYLIDRIPDQRMHRLFAFLEELESRIQALEDRTVIQNEDFEALAENAIIESAKSRSKDRLKWLASIAIPSSGSPSSKEWDLRTKAVGILADLTDSDVEFLLLHADPESLFRFEHNFGYYEPISRADQDNLPDYDLFLKHLDNKYIDLHRHPLVRHGFMEYKANDNFPRYRLTEEGRIFIYLITGKFPRH